MEMLYMSNLLALVGGGRNPKSPTNRFEIYDDKLSAVVVTIDLRSEIKAICLRRDRF